jgi:hypothetical protein
MVVLSAFVELQGTKKPEGWMERLWLFLKFHHRVLIHQPL